MSKYKYRSFWEFLAVGLALVSFVSIVLAFACPCLHEQFGNTAITFATLAGAILVFSTLEIQRKALHEEKSKNDVSQFDSRFYPILSSFRKDAANLEIFGDYLSDNGIGVRKIYKGENGFKAAKSMIRGIKNNLKDNDFIEFDREDFDMVLEEYSKIFDALDEDYPLHDDVMEEEEEKMKEFIKTKQVPYLMSKMGITKEYKQKEEKEVDVFLLEKLLEYQSATLSKYVKSLRFILHIIDKESKESQRSIYLLHIATLLGQQELEFLKCFHEFDIITSVTII